MGGENLKILGFMPLYPTLDHIQFSPITFPYLP